MKDLFGKILPRNLIFQSVLLAVQKSVNSIAPNFDLGRLMDTESFLREHWKIFLDGLSHRIHALSYFRKKRREEVFACGNVSII